MSRTRISTTVDANCLARARAVGHERDSVLFDKALRAYIEQVAAEQERTALDQFPYGSDPELEMPEAHDDLPYEGKIPDDVVRLAKHRRTQRALP